MTSYVWNHELSGEEQRLRLMSELLDPSSRRHLSGLVQPGWHCLEIGAGNGSLSEWLADAVGRGGRVLATDLQTDYFTARARGNLETRQLDATMDAPAFDDAFDLVACRAILHHLPARETVLQRMLRWTKPGGVVFVHEPDFTPTLTVEPDDQRRFWALFLEWAASKKIDYFVGRKIPGWLRQFGAIEICAVSESAVYHGGSEWADWWVRSIGEVTGRLCAEGRVPAAMLDHLRALYADPRYWTSTIAFTATIGRRAPASAGSPAARAELTCGGGAGSAAPPGAPPGPPASA